MSRLIALSILLCSIAFSGAASAGKLGFGSRIHNPPTLMLGTSSQCGVGPHQPGPWTRCPPSQNPATPKPVPHGGCGYYGPNGVLIRCK